jgi:hypothetical protein
MAIALHPHTNQNLLAKLGLGRRTHFRAFLNAGHTNENYIHSVAAF